MKKQIQIYNMVPCDLEEEKKIYFYFDSYVWSENCNRYKGRRDLQLGS